MRFSAELPPVWHVQFEFSWPCDFRLYVVSKVPHWLSLSRPDVSLQRIMCSDMCMFVSTYESVCNLCAHLYSPATTMLAVNIHQNQWHVSVAMYNPDICTKHCTLCIVYIVCYLTFTLGGEGGGVPGVKAAEPPNQWPQVESAYRHS